MGIGKLQIVYNKSEEVTYQPCCLHAREKEEKLKTKKKKTGQAECEQRRHDDCITAKVDGLADYLVQPQLAIFFVCCG